MTHDMSPFEFRPSNTGRAAEAGMRTIDAISVDFTKASDPPAKLDPANAPFFIMQMALGQYLIDITPTMSAQTLLSRGALTKDELTVALVASLCPEQLTIETTRINDWLDAGGRPPITIDQARAMLSSALADTATADTLRAMVVGIIITCIAQSVIQHVVGQQ